MRRKDLWCSGNLNKPLLSMSNVASKNATAYFMKKMLLLVLLLAAWPLLSARAQAPAPPVPGSSPNAPPPAAVPTDLSPAVADVVRLAGSGVGDDVVLAFVQNSTATFHLSADDILYLRDIGLSPAVT